MAVKKISKIKYILKYVGFFQYLNMRSCSKRAKNILNLDDDRKYLENKFFCCSGYKLNLNNPITLNEKLQWLKLYWRDSLAEKCSDKYEVREYIKEKGYESYLIPLYGLYNSLDEINFSDLPDSFAIKATHDSGGVYLVKKKTEEEIRAAKKYINEALLKRNYALDSKEWVYENIKPRILVEHFILGKDNNVPCDYKFYCFHGEVKFILVSSNRSIDLRENYFNLTWDPIHVVNGTLPGKTIKKPDKLDEMIQISKVLSKPFPHVRVDFYYENGRIYIGELTFFSASGMTNFYPFSYDKLFGSYLDLSTIKNKEYIAQK